MWSGKGLAQLFFDVGKEERPRGAGFPLLHVPPHQTWEVSPARTQRGLRNFFLFFLKESVAREGTRRTFFPSSSLTCQI